jgi:SAM-dependent methyltransferase
MTLWSHILDGKKHLIPGARILEVGSYDVNGTIRPWFKEAREYVGVDWRPGPGVDVVSLAHEMQFPAPFDFVCSASMLEHDPHWQKSLTRMTELVAPGGYLALSWGAMENPQHNNETAPDGGFHALAVRKVMSHLGHLGWFVHRFLYEQTIHCGYCPGDVGLLAARIPAEHPEIEPLHPCDEVDA